MEKDTREDNKQVFAFKDGTIGYMAEICTCENCKKQGSATI